jgi:DNA-binding transcriptional regulator LsrR (DeoR family)
VTDKDLSDDACPRDRAALIKAARMYFLDGRSQDDVARALGTSRSNVSRMLTAAQAQGIVEIRVHDQTSRENALREQFELAHVRVAALRPGVDAQAAAGDLAAQWLDESLRDGQVLGLSWGTSLQAVLASFSVDQPRSVELVPLIGGLSTVVSLVSGEELVRELAGKLGATYRYLHAPGVLRIQDGTGLVAGGTGHRRSPRSRADRGHRHGRDRGGWRRVERSNHPRSRADRGGA